MEPLREQLIHSIRIVLRLLDVIISAVEILLGLRILLRLFGANPSSAFTSWLYTTTDQMLIPFYNIFPSAAFSNTGIIDFSALFAMLAYGFLGWILIRCVAFITDALGMR